MLVLSRKVGQRVNIGYDVVVTLVEVKGNRARLGIEGPSAVPIHRSEIFERIQGSRDPCMNDSLQDEDCHM